MLQHINSVRQQSVASVGRIGRMHLNRKPLAIDNEFGDALSVMSSIAEHQLSRFRSLVVKVELVVPGESDSAVSLDSKITDLAI